MTQLSGSLGTPSASRSKLGGNGPMISAGGVPYVYIYDDSRPASASPSSEKGPQRKVVA